MTARRQTLNLVRPIILLCVVLGVIIGLYASFDMLANQLWPQLPVVQTVVTSNPVITQLPTDQVFNNQYAELQPQMISSYATQASNVAETYPTPLPPLNLTARATPFGGSAILTWTLPLGESVDTVEVYRSTTAQAHDTLLATVTGTTQSFLDLGITDGTSYYYSLRANRQVNQETQHSAFTDTVSISTTDTTPPDAPTKVTVTPAATAPNYLTMQWAAVTSEPIDHYVIYRSLVVGELGKAITTVPIDTLTYTDTTVTAATTYYYTVTAVDVAGNESTSTLPDNQVGNAELFVDSVTSAAQKLHLFQ